MTRLFLLVSFLVFSAQIGFGQEDFELCTDGSQNSCLCTTAPALCTIEELDGFSYTMDLFPADVDEFDGELVLYSDTSYTSSSAGEDAANGNEDEKDASVVHVQVDYRSERQKERERIRRSEN